MRKFIIGAIFGAALMVSVSAHAEVVNMIGKVVDGAFPVKVNGVELQNQAIVIEGTSYLPVRAVGEALNMDVLFDTTTGAELKTKVDVEATERAIDAVQKTINMYETKVKRSETELEKAQISGNANLVNHYTIEIENAKKEIERFTKEKAVLQSRLST